MRSEERVNFVRWNFLRNSATLIMQTQSTRLMGYLCITTSEHFPELLRSFLCLAANGIKFFGIWDGYFWESLLFPVNKILLLSKTNIIDILCSSMYLGYQNTAARLLDWEDHFFSGHRAVAGDGGHIFSLWRNHKLNRTFIACCNIFYLLCDNELLSTKSF